MGKAGRFVCVFIPMVLTLASLVFLIMVGLGGTNAKNSYLSNIYFLQANTTVAAHNSTLLSANPGLKLDNFYAIGLWGYCGGASTNGSASVLSVGQTSAFTVDYCTPRDLHFWFDPRAVWGLKDAFAPQFLGQQLNDTLTWYQSNASKWLSTLFILAVVSTAVEILVGTFGLFSRLGSIFTTIASLISSALLSAFVLLATITYAGLGAAFNAALQPKYNISFSLGRTMFIYMWLAVACSFVSGLFWAFSSCCCSGRSRQPVYTKAERTPYTYENIDGPYTTQHVGPQQHAGGRPTAYEPYRHGQ
ncbi:hypothetical protein MMC30_002419 [Trapelia coarctata]|nr:hypothetical protein [Trapelia coarctata]